MLQELIGDGEEEETDALRIIGYTISKKIDAALALLESAPKTETAEA